MKILRAIVSQRISSLVSSISPELLASVYASKPRSASTRPTRVTIDTRRRTEFHDHSSLRVLEVNLRDIAGNRAQTHRDKLLQTFEVYLRLILIVVTFGGVFRRAGDDTRARVVVRDRARRRRSDHSLALRQRSGHGARESLNEVGWGRLGCSLVWDDMVQIN